MRFPTKRIAYQPGVVAPAAAHTIPATCPRMGAILHAEILRNNHAHTSIGIDATAVAGDIAAFVGLQDGAGAAVVGVTIGHAGGAGADITVPSSTNTATPALVAAVPTRTSATGFTLDVATQANDILVLDIVEEGAFPAVA